MSGSATIYCSTLGQWSTPPTCEYNENPQAQSIGSCGPAPRLPHASQITSFGQQQSSVGDTATYQCDPGYVLEGPETIFCVARGYWSPLPACREDPNAAQSSTTTASNTGSGTSQGTNCPEPPYLVDGEYFKGYTGEAVPGSVAYYRCNEGYTLSGSDQSLCTDSGVWRSVNGAPYCERNTNTGSGAGSGGTGNAAAGTNGCMPPPTISHGQAIRYYTQDPPAPGSYVVYECDTGYQIQGTPSITCQSDYTWTPAPRCLSAVPSTTTCGEPPQIPNAKADRFYSGSRSQPGDYVAYDCSTGYELQGVPTSVCQDSGDWSRPPTCVVSTCGSAPAIINGVITGQTFMNPDSRINDQVRYQCVDDYEFAPGSSSTVVCQGNGTWSTSPRCIRCSQSTSTPTVTSTSVSETTPTTTTEAPTCGTPPSVTNAVAVPLYSSSVSRIGDSVSYQCQTGFEMLGYPITYCLSNCKWSPAPTCRWMPPHHHLPAPAPPTIPHHHHHIPPPPVIMTCPMPPSIANGHVIPTKQANFVTYRCFDGFEISGTPFAVCQCATSDGMCMWTPSPTCEQANDSSTNDGGDNNTSTTASTEQPSTTTVPPPTCGPAPFINFGQCMLVAPDFDDTIPDMMPNFTIPMTYDDAIPVLAQKGDRAHCQCYSGYDLQGPPNVYCQSE